MTTTPNVTVERMCPHSGTSPTEAEYKGKSYGGWNDGGFYWCPCGCIVEWIGKAGTGTVEVHAPELVLWLNEQIRTTGDHMALAAYRRVVDHILDPLQP